MSVKLFCRGKYQNLRFSIFPAGEVFVRIIDVLDVSLAKSATIEVHYEGDYDLMRRRLRA